MDLGPHSAVRTCVAVLEREVSASLERVLENVLDWEHLPWLHRASFCGIELEAADREGWRARIALPPASAPRWLRTEVRLDRPGHRYVTRTLEGAGAGTEIWTQLTPRGATTGIRVEFQVPGVTAIPSAQADALGAAYLSLYQRLWDEDEAMMRRRQAWLDGAGERAHSLRSAVSLGARAALRDEVPRVVAAAGRAWVVREHAGELVVHAADCPHLGGPLDEADLDAEGCVVCPWHGYRFDVRTGRSCDGRRLALPAAPRLRINPASEEVTLELPAAPEPDTCAR
jgi:nitrite reductase/ring-hydroxylating ferredoxin subunit